MSRIFLRSVASALVIAVVIMLTATIGPAFAHEVQHAAHHNAGMHGTGICAWMCASAGAVITPIVQPVESTIVQPSVVPAESHPVYLIFANRLQARAPPVLL